MVLTPASLFQTPQERIKEVTDKFNAELEADRHKFELLLQEKNEQELEYEEKLKQVGSWWKWQPEAFVHHRYRRLKSDAWFI